MSRSSVESESAEKNESPSGNFSGKDESVSAEVNERTEKNGQFSYQVNVNRNEEEKPADVKTSETHSPQSPKNKPEETDDSESEEDHTELLMGKPSLRTAQKAAVKSSNTVSKQPEPEADVTKSKALQNLSDIEEHWDDVLEMVQNKASKTLYLQLADVQLKDLKGTELILSVNNPFAVSILETNKKKIGNIFKEVTGAYVRIRCVVERNGEDNSAYLSPFEKFQELQKKDKNLKTIVELFGAEIEHI
jgi:chromosomal replication initiation ATPase DnaA